MPQTPLNQPADDSRPAWETDPKLRRKVGRKAFVLRMIAAMLFPTWRLQVQPFEPGLEMSESKGAICALWHAKQLPIFYAFRRRGVATMVSRSADGEVVTRLLLRLGYKAVRGSSSRGAVGAARELTRCIGPGQVVAVTIDGPRGPRHIVKPGVLHMAKQTGAPIVPIFAAVKRAWIFPKSWDRFCLPKPFTPGLVVLAPPVYVPADADESTMETIRLRLQEQMVEYERETEAHAGTAAQRREWIKRCDDRFRTAIADCEL